MLIVVDGIDGSGKGTVLETWKNYLAQEGNAIFDLRKYCLENKDYPPLEEIRSYDFISSVEPTYAGVGRAIRFELVGKDNDYPPRAIAEAFSLDRLILYKKLIIPLLKDGRCIIQERSVSSSIAYQTQTPDLNIEVVSNLIGNKLALEYRPDHLVLMDIDAEEALRRLAGRKEKQDNSIFEKLDFLKKMAEFYKSKVYQNVFTSRGTQIHYLSSEQNIDIMKQNSINLLKSILKK